MRAWIVGLLCLVTACASPLGAGERHYAGIYAEGLETMTFLADGEEQPWAVAGSAVYVLQAAAPARDDPRDGFELRAIVKGRLSPPGRYGHLGMFRRELTITDVIQASAPETQR